MSKIFILALIIAGTSYYYSLKSNTHKLLGPVWLKSLELRLDLGLFRLYDTYGRVSLELKYGLNLQLGQPTVCKSNKDIAHCLLWPGVVQLQVNYTNNDDAECYSLRWTPQTKDSIPFDCMDVTNTHWYGGGEVYEQHWPSSKQQIPMQPFVSNDVLGVGAKHTWGSVIESFWISSRGVGIFVDKNTNLHASLNENRNKKLCFKAKYSEPPFSSMSKKVNNLGYTICQAHQPNVKSIYKYLSNLAFEKPKGIPDIRMFKSPIWSTWARYKIHINQTKVLQYAREISKYNFSNSQLEIDDMFSSGYGEIDFSVEKFPDPKGMVNQLHKMGYRVTIWEHPFANVDSPSFIEGMHKGYWVMDKSGKVPGLIRWWQGVGAVLDVTNNEAVAWYVSRLKSLKQFTGIDSFKFDAGEVIYLPPGFVTKQPIGHPAEFTTKYAELVSSMGTQVELRASYQSQSNPVFVRMFDKDSTWSYQNGLKTMIPTALVMGLIGYPYILPDMIGGNAYAEGNFHETAMPDRELFIRWLQLSAYLPSMQFSLTPWQYDDEVVNIARRMVSIHEEEVTPIILELAKESVENGSPIIRPLWWISPYDEYALSCDSQFLIGNYKVVAPILDEGSTSRDIYIPNGNWYDDLKKETIPGPKWLRDYNIKLSEIATFTKK